MKKKALVLAVCMAFATPAVSVAKALPGNIVSLNLGEIKSQSFLGEPFKGIIPILFTSPHQAKKLKVRLAPSSVFSQIGAEKTPILNTLSFTISTRNKKPVILISSKRPIHLPFLNFILEIESPKGNIYQDYTVMLDPRKINKAQETLAIESKVFNYSYASTLPSVYSSLRISKNHSSTYTVRSGDSVSKIAKSFKPKGITLSKLIRAIHLKNTTAFIDNNINKIRKGAIISIPSLNELKNLSSIKAESKTKNKTGGKKVTNQTIVSGEKTYKVKKGDSLSKITRKFVSEGASFTKMMKLIYTSNPHAFSKNRINLLKVDSILTIPVFENTTSKSDVKKTISATVEKPEKNTTENSQLADSKQEEVIESENKTNSIASTKNVKDSISDNTATKNSPAFNDTIKALKKANTEIVDNLEKRLREIRNDLTKITSDKINLETTLEKKESLIEKQQFEIDSLKEKLNLLQVEKDSPSDSNLNFDSETTETGIKAETSLLSETSMNNDETIETNKTVDSDIKSAGIDIERVGYISDKTSAKIDHIMSNITNNDANPISAKDLTYTILALLLGLGLIRYRKKIYSYRSISYDHPNYYPSKGQREVANKQKEEANNETLEFNETLVSPDYDITKASKNKPKKDSEISEEELLECEHLVDELLDNLEDKQEIPSESKLILESVCDQEMEKITKEEKSIEEEFLFINDEQSGSDENLSTKMQSTETDFIENQLKALDKKILGGDPDFIRAFNNTDIDNKSPVTSIETQPKKTETQEKLKIKISDL